MIIPQIIIDREEMLAIAKSRQMAGHKNDTYSLDYYMPKCKACNQARDVLLQVEYGDDSWESVFFCQSCLELIAGMMKKKKDGKNEKI